MAHILDHLNVEDLEQRLSISNAQFDRFRRLERPRDQRLVVIREALHSELRAIFTCYAGLRIVENRKYRRSLKAPAVHLEQRSWLSASRVALRPATEMLARKFPKLLLSNHASNASTSEKSSTTVFNSLA